MVRLHRSSPPERQAAASRVDGCLRQVEERLTFLSKAEQLQKHQPTGTRSVRGAAGAAAGCC